MPDERTLEFLTLLFNPEGAGEGLVALFFLKRPSQSYPAQFHVSKLPDALEEVSSRQGDGWDCYFSPAVLKAPPATGSRGRKDDFLGSRALWVDLDPEAERTQVQIIEELGMFNPKPSVIVNSGRGVHAYWFLQELVTDRQAIEHRNLWLANRLGGDHCHSIDHLLRVPGSKNFK